MVREASKHLAKRSLCEYFSHLWADPVFSGLFGGLLSTFSLAFFGRLLALVSLSLLCVHGIQGWKGRKEEDSAFLKKNIPLILCI